MLGVAMFGFNIGSAICTFHDLSAAEALVRYGGIQFCWLAMSAWIIVYVLILNENVLRPRGCFVRMLLRFQSFFAWGVPAVLVAAMFGINPHPESEGG
jgi:hypothetical protein